MLIKLIVLIAFIAFVGWILISTLLHTLGLSDKSRLMKKTRKEAKAANIKVWNSSTHIQELLNSYMAMVLKHGPESQEATAFRYGAENQHILKDNECLQAFNKVADIFLDNYKDIYK